MPRRAKPHDRLFQWVFSKAPIAAAHLKRALPPEVANALRWDQLRPAPESLLDGQLKGRTPDLHFEVPGPRPALVRLLFHHQSTADPFMALRLLSETARLLERWRREHPKAKRLPWVLPVVVHHGRYPWRAPTDLRQLLAAPATARARPDGLLPSLPFLLQDLAVIPEDDLGGDPLGALTLRLLKHAHHRDLWGRLPRWEALIRQARQEHGLAGLEVAMEYMFMVCRDPKEDEAQWFAEALGPEEDQMFKSYASVLHDQGREVGREEGQEAGRTAERRALILRLLPRRFQPLSAAQRAQVEAASPEQLDRSIDALLVAPSVEALLQE